MERYRPQELRLHVVRTMQDDGDARLRQLLRAESLVSLVRAGPERAAAQLGTSHQAKVAPRWAPMAWCGRGGASDFRRPPRLSASIARYAANRFSNRTTDVACHSPSRGVGIARRFS